MAVGGEASTTRQKNFCVRIKFPLIGEFQLRIFKSYDEKEAKLHPASWEAGVRVARPSSQYCNCTKNVWKNPIKNLLKKKIIRVYNSPTAINSLYTHHPSLPKAQASYIFWIWKVDKKSEDYFKTNQQTRNLPFFRTVVCDNVLDVIKHVRHHH